MFPPFPESAHMPLRRLSPEELIVRWYEVLVYRYSIFGEIPAGRFSRGVDEAAHLLRIFAARLAFHAAGHIHAVRPHDAYSVRDILCGQPAGKHHRHAEVEVLEQLPRRRFAGAAVLSLHAGIN